MLLTFIDESARGQKYYYMGALLVGSQAAVQIEKSFDQIGAMVASQVRGFDPKTELHAYELFQGKALWKDVPVSLRVKASRLAAKSLHQAGAKFVFRGIDVPALERKYSKPHEPHALALCHALESVQNVINWDYNNEEFALVLADEHHSAPDSRSRFGNLKNGALEGFTKVPLHNFLDTIYFGPSHHSRLLQAADIATFFTNRYMTVEENHPVARTAMASIQTSLMSITRYKYIWSPT
ncbi:DUF3800 domain-containing protein [Arthrobacter subterraneus]|nr:DUF3800 domain-containing protein [Arthrobacter subterraneus]